MISSAWGTNVRCSYCWSSCVWSYSRKTFVKSLCRRGLVPAPPAANAKPKPIMQREKQYVDDRLDHRGDPAEGERARDRIHDGERYRHMQHHLTGALCRDNHATNIGTGRLKYQLEVAMPAFGAGYQKRIAMPSSSPSEFTKS